MLSAQFHPLQIDADLRRAFPPHVLTPLPPFLLDRVRRCALVWGHYDVPSIRRLGADRFTFTLLREPKARIVSLYRYWRGQAALDLGWNGMNQPVLAAQRLSLAEFLATDDPWILDYIDNFYVRAADRAILQLWARSAARGAGGMARPGVADAAGIRFRRAGPRILAAQSSGLPVCSGSWPRRRWRG